MVCRNFILPENSNLCSFYAKKMLEQFVTTPTFITEPGKEGLPQKAAPLTMFSTSYFAIL